MSRWAAGWVVYTDRMSALGRWMRKHGTLLGVLAIAWVLLLRAMQLRLPHLTSFINEDDIHHNFWLLQYGSVLGDYVVWQLQPLLDYVLRLYFWFPFFGLPTAWQYGLGAAALALAAGLGWALLPAGAQRAGRLARVLLWANAVSWLAALGFLLVMLPRSGGGLGWSVRSWLLLLAAAAVCAGLLWLVWRITPARAAAWAARVPATPWRWAALLACLLSVTLAWLSVYAPGVFPARLQPQVASSLPLLVAVGVASFSVLVLAGLRRGWPAALWALALALFLGLMFKPLGQGAHYSELVLKLPSLFFGFLGVLAAFMLPALYLRTRNLPAWLGLALSLVCALWVLYHPVHISMSGFARHYSLMALASLLWFWQFVFRRPSGVAFWLLSLLMANTHYFALPFVLGAYAYQAAPLAAQRQWRPAARQLGLGASVVLVTLLVNWPVTQEYLALVAGGASLPLAARLQGAASLLQQFAYFVGYPLAAAGPLASLAGYGLLAAIGLALLYGWRTPRWHKLAYLLGVLVVTCIVLAGSTGFAFQARYFLIYMGLGLVGLALALETLAERAMGPHRTPRGLLAGLALAALLPFAFTASADLLLGLWRARAVISQPLPKNDSGFYHVYTAIRQTQRPFLLVLNTPIAVQQDIPLFYLDYVDGGTAQPYEIITVGLPAEQAHVAVEGFLQRHPQGLVFYDWLLDNSCTDQPNRLVQAAQVSRVAVPGACMWQIEGASSHAALCAIAAQLGFPPEEGANFCSPAQ